MTLLPIIRSQGRTGRSSGWRSAGSHPIRMYHYLAFTLLGCTNLCFFKGSFDVLKGFFVPATILTGLSDGARISKEVLPSYCLKSASLHLDQITTRFIHIWLLTGTLWTHYVHLQILYDGRGECALCSFVLDKIEACLYLIR